MGQKIIPKLEDLKNDLKKLADPKRAESSAWFFKTAPGQYGHGDVFLGVTVPNQRKVAKSYYGLELEQVEQLMLSKEHEYRLVAVIILVEQFKKASDTTKKQIYDFYLSHTQYINNWDIVDTSAGYIVGEYLWCKKDALKILTKLAKSNFLWERRIAIISTLAFIMHGESELTLEIAQILISDDHDLIQKAVGWMLREVGKRVSLEDEERFLKHNNQYQTMPRTMLRYAIERFDETKRQAYLKGII